MIYINLYNFDKFITLFYLYIFTKKFYFENLKKNSIEYLF